MRCSSPDGFKLHMASRHQVTESLWLEKTSQDPQVQPQPTLTMSPSATSACFLNISRDRHPTALWAAVPVHYHSLESKLLLISSVEYVQAVQAMVVPRVILHFSPDPAALGDGNWLSVGGMLWAEKTWLFPKFS